MTAADRALLRRLAVVVIFLFVFTAAFAHLYGVYSHKFLGITGEARWIWARHRMSANEPVAFFAARDFVLPERRFFTHLKIAGDPEYTVYLNGRQVAGRLVGENRSLDHYDVSELVRTGRNRIVVAIRAPQGVGGLLASIDIAPETQNWLVTDGAWKIYRAWHPALPQRDVPDLGWEPPLVVGQPPIGRWNYLAIARRAVELPSANVQQPRQAFPVIAQFPTIRTVSGVAVASAQKSRATAFDFGFTRGQVRLTLGKPHFASRAINIRFANVESELGLIEWSLRPIVFAPGETVVTTPEAHNFRYVMAFGRGVRVEVVR